MKKPYHLLLLVGLVACSGTTTHHQQQEEKVTVEGYSAIDASEASSNGIRLEGLYATSTKLPEHQYSLHNIFDNNSNTYWATMTGSGINEGFMLYFEETTQVDSIMLQAYEEGEFSKGNVVSVYFNGQYQQNTKTTETILANKKLKSLYIKFEHNEDVKNTSFSEEDIQELTIIQYPKNKSVAIAEMKVYSHGKPLTLLTPKTLNSKVTASSTLEPVSSYGVHNLFDSKKEAAWAVGTPEGGKNEFIIFEFDSPQKITSLKIRNGFQRSENHFTANNRVKNFSFGAIDGEQTTYQLKDEGNWQLVQLTKPVEANQFKFTVQDIYAGNKYKDLVISEIKFNNGTEDLVLETGQRNILKEDLQKKIEGTVIENLLDRNINNDVFYYDSEEHQDISLILRSDYTFVLYQSTRTYYGSEEKTIETVSDGNWEIKELNKDKAVVRIFGKRSNTTATNDYYKGSTEKSYDHIFQDFLTVKKDSIYGQKFVGKILIKNEAK